MYGLGHFLFICSASQHKQHNIVVNENVGQPAYMNIILEPIASTSILIN